ncbi:GGDEF domain-containing protein [Deinococcus knuensis]|uniref:GGDEF domain-containing protein n=1 Tax=Deinococcus knuensis TaxID=1837380 RepID=A0ABQ2SLU5_9DEIO|nr:GGDEF domain-containing protein [Deinococcus knuensis]GGS33793.1 hypothetical protein GCM10008961_26980 [Deinococcus knuensis]
MAISTAPAAPFPPRPLPELTLMNLDNDLFQHLPVPAVQWAASHVGHARQNPAFTRAFAPGTLSVPLPHWTDGVHLTRLQAASGEDRVCRVTLSTLPSQDRVAVIEDVHAYHLDPLTGLPDRRALLLDAGQPVPGSAATLALLDVDHLAQVNGALGRAAGDRALRTLGDLLGRAARAGSAHAYRLGGDEFVICAQHPLTDTHLGGLQARYRDALRALGIPGGSFSYALAYAPQHGGTLSDLLTHAATQLGRQQRDRRGGLGGHLERLMHGRRAHPGGTHPGSADRERREAGPAAPLDPRDEARVARWHRGALL